MTPAEHANTIREAFYTICVSLKDKGERYPWQDEALAALDALQAQAARVEELEAALREISAVRLPTGNAVGRDELRGCHRARTEMQRIARAALAKEA